MRKNKDKIISAAQIPQNDGPQLEFISNTKLIIDCCDSILEYQPETIKIKFKNFSIRIIGKDLLLCNLRGQSIMITGTIWNVDFTE